MKYLENLNKIIDYNQDILFVDLVMHSDLSYIFKKFEPIVKQQNVAVDAYVSLEWVDRIIKHFDFIRNKQGYIYRGCIASVFNYHLILSSFKNKYDLIIINCDDDRKFLRYFIFNLIFIRRKSVYILNGGNLYKLRYNMYYDALLEFFRWFFYLIFEFFISFAICQYLLILHNFDKIKARIK